MAGDHALPLERAHHRSSDPRTDFWNPTRDEAEAMTRLRKITKLHSEIHDLDIIHSRLMPSSAPPRGVSASVQPTGHGGRWQATSCRSIRWSVGEVADLQRGVTELLTSKT